MKGIKEVTKMVKVLHKMYLNEVGETNEFSNLEEETRYLLAYTLKKEYLSAYKETDSYSLFDIYNLNNMELVDIIPINYNTLETQLLNFAYEGLVAIPRYFGKYKITCEETGELWHENSAEDIVIILNDHVGEDRCSFNIKNLLTGITTSIAITNWTTQFFAYGDNIYKTFLRADLTEGSMLYNLDPDRSKVEDEK